MATATTEKQANSIEQFRVPMMFHPSHDVVDLDQAEDWYERVFGCPSVRLSSLSPPADRDKKDSEYPRDYCTFTPMRDVLFDTIDPSRYVFGGAQQLPSIAESHLRMVVWYVDGMDEAFRTLTRNGVRILNQLNEIVGGDSAPESHAAKMKLMFTVPEDAGMRYGLFPADVDQSYDPRTKHGWSLSAPAGSNPLGLDRCSHHTILTDSPARSLRFHELLGAKVIHEGRNDVIGASSVYVHLGGSTIEIAVPDQAVPAFADWRKRAPDDTYHSVTWQVTDLARTERHLRDNGVDFVSHGSDTISTEARTSLGVPWVFTTKLIPSDPRSLD